MRGQELRVLAGRWRAGRLTFFCDAGGMRVSLPQEWTDRGPEPGGEPVSAESLAVLRDLLDTLACRRPDRGEPVDHDHQPLT
jgi:hypothetical protein